jgi:hypothetical protein
MIKYTLTILFSLLSISCAYPAPCTIIIGASLASNNWPKVILKDGAESTASRNALIKGNYKGFCPLLAKEFTKRTISCQAEAGAMSTDFILPLPDGSTIKASGYLKQLDKGIRECTWNNKLLADSLIISLVNDGPTSIENTKIVIDKAKSLGINNIIVQAFTAIPNYTLERDMAIINHGTYWGGVIQLFLSNIPTLEQYTALRQAHRAELEFYPGVTNYFNFYKNSYITIDGAHPTLDSQKLAVQELLYNFIIN